MQHYPFDCKLFKSFTAANAAMDEFKFLGNSVMVARLTLDQLVKVRILVPQVFDAADAFFSYLPYSP